MSPWTPRQLHRPARRGAGRRRGEQRFPKWAIWVLIGLVIGVLGISSMANRGTGNEISYSEFMEQVTQDKVESITFDNTSGRITGEYKDGTNFRTTGYLEFPEEDLQTLREQNVDVKPKTPQSSLLGVDPPLPPPLRPADPLLLVDAAESRRADGQHHVDRAVAGEDLLDRAALDHLRRRRRLRQASSRRSGRSSTSCGPPSASPPSVPASPRACCWSGRRERARR